MLGYFIDADAERLGVFLAEQRRSGSIASARWCRSLSDHGIPLDADAILSPGTTDTTKSAGRPWIARALVAAATSQTIGEAFERWLSRGRPAFVARIGPAPEEVIREVHSAGGIASLAHPGLLQRDDWIPGLAAGGPRRHRGVPHQARRRTTRSAI